MKITEVDQLRAIDDLEHVYHKLFEWNEARGGQPLDPEALELRLMMRRALTILHQAQRERG